MKRDLQFTTFLLMLLVLGCIQCTPIYYAPLNTISPNLKEKGDIAISGNILNNFTKGISIDIATSPLDNFGILVKHSRQKYPYSTFVMDTSDGYYQNRSIQFNTTDLAIGAYTSFSEWVQFKFYTSIGTTSFRDDIFNGKISKIGIHPSIEFQSNYVDIGLHGNLNRLKYHKLKEDMIIDGLSQNAYLTNYADHFMAEVYLSVTKKIDSQLTINSEIGVSRNISHPAFKQQTILYSGGVTINLNYFNFQ